MLSPQSLSIEPLRRDRITAISAAVQRRPIVLVLGMHRSGTSLCSHILSALGVDMADKIPGPGATSPHPSNPRGHWERWEIVEFHDRILSLFNRDYLGHFHDFALPVAWWADPRVAQIRREIIAFLEQRMGESYFGFKDPRTVRLMPVWHQMLNELKLAPKLVLCLRNPAQIGRSLKARDGLDPEIGEYRWLVHMIDFFRYTSKYDFCIIEYEEWFSNPSANIEKLQTFLDLQWQQSEADLGLVLSGIIDPGARHDSNHREASQPLVRTLYTLASRADQDGGARDQIAYIVSQFVSFQQLQWPFLQVFEDLAKTVAKYREIEQDAKALRAVISERDAVVAAAEARAVAVEGRLAEALAEIEGQRAQIVEISSERDERAAAVSARDAVAAAAEARAVAVEGRLAEALAEIAGQRAQIVEISSERDERAATLAERETALAESSHRADELEAALQAVQAELAAREAVLAESLHRADELQAALQVAQAELAAREAALQRAKQEAEERAAAALAMQSKIAALRNALAQAERAEQERAAAAEAMQREIGGLRSGLARAEREAQQRAAAGAAIQNEIAALRGTLAQAERGTLAQAEREAQERAAAEAALQAEIVALQGTLTAARQVGKVAIAAFRTSSAAPTKPDGPRGWRQAIMRFFGAGMSF